MNNTSEEASPRSIQSQSTTNIVLGSIMTVQCTLATLENLLVISVILIKVPLSKKPINSLILSLSVADLLQALVQQLPSVIVRFQHTWTMGIVICAVHITSRSAFPQAGMLLIGLIGIERFRSLNRTDGVAFSVRTTRVLILAVWGVSVGTALPMAFWFDVISYSGGFKRCTYIRDDASTAVVYTVVTSVAFFLVPMVMTWFCYMGVIYRIIKSSRKVVQNQTNNSANTVRRQRILRVSRICVLIAVVNTVCWAPINIILVYGTVLSDFRVLSLMQFVWLVSAFSSFINPLIYGLMMPTFRDALIQFLRCQTATESIEQRT